MLRLAFLDRRAQWTADDLGHMNSSCEACGAYHWSCEKGKSRRSIDHQIYEACCKHGDVILDKMWLLPEPLNGLMSGGDAQSISFRDILR